MVIPPITTTPSTPDYPLSSPADGVSFIAFIFLDFIFVMARKYFMFSHFFRTASWFGFFLFFRRLLPSQLCCY